MEERLGIKIKLEKVYMIKEGERKKGIVVMIER